MKMDHDIDIPEPHEGQQKILEKAKRFNVLQCGRRFGKTTLGFHILCMAALFGFPWGWFSPTYKHMSEVWDKTQSVLGPIISRTDKQLRQVHFHTGARIDFWSLDKADAGRGFKYKGVCIDEASVIRNLNVAWQEDIRPALTDYKGQAWILGTPKGQNFFHQLFLKGQGANTNWKSWRLGTIDNPTIPDLEEELAEAKAELPKAIFDQEYLGIPADDGGNPFGLDRIASIFGAASAHRAEWFGWDLAKSHDWTWGVGLDNEGVQAVSDRFQMPWGETKERIIDVTKWNPALVDSTGVGDPIVEDLILEGSNFEGFKFSQSSKQSLMMGLRSAIHTQGIRIFDPALKAELESFYYEYSPGGGVKYTAPSGMHDDGVMALALAVEKMRRGNTDGVVRSTKGLKLGGSRALPMTGRGVSL